MDPQMAHEPVRSHGTDVSYRYESLDHSSSQSRVFTLLASTDKTSPLHSDLGVVFLSPKQPMYEALSYVWGDQTKTCLLWIGSKELSISQSLSHALFHIRHRFQPRDIWIDAICINQDSSDEKNHQVRKMYTIFSLAFRVLIWLGEADEDNNYAMANFGRLDSLDVDIPSVSKLFKRPWWRRMWTLQEGLAGSKDSLVLCGERKIAWETVIQDIRYLLHPETVERHGMHINYRLQHFPQVHSSRRNTQRVT
jgi:hypothetical protein